MVIRLMAAAILGVTAQGAVVVSRRWRVKGYAVVRPVPNGVVRAVPAGVPLDFISSAGEDVIGYLDPDAAVVRRVSIRRGVDFALPTPVTAIDLTDDTWSRVRSGALRVDRVPTV